MSTTLIHAAEFFATARERYRIKLRREEGLPAPWTTNQQFKTWRFCQVHREDDRTTVWFRDNIRGPLSTFLNPEEPPTPEQLLRILEATLIFRWFNRIETGEAVKDLLLYGWDTKEARERLTGVSPIVTGAYIIKAGDGVSKLEGILACIDQARPQLPGFIERWRGVSCARCGATCNWEVPCPKNSAPGQIHLVPEKSLKHAWEDLKTLNYMGGFMSYEAVSDLRWTPVLDKAVDIMTWANAGPGCARGLGWVTAQNPYIFNCGPKDQREMLPLMRELLAMSKSEEFWPQEWRKWEMREVEHWNCEYDKWCRARAGQGLKRRYSER